MWFNTLKENGLKSLNLAEHYAKFLESKVIKHQFMVFLMSLRLLNFASLSSFHDKTGGVVHLHYIY